MKPGEAQTVYICVCFFNILQETSFLTTVSALGKLATGEPCHISGG